MQFSFKFAVLGVALSFGSMLAAAQSYPSRPITIVVGGPPGASSDFVSRLVAESLTRELGQPVIVDNKPGAGGIVAVKYALAAKPDGYTLLLFYSDNMVVAPYLQKVLPYDPIKDVTYVAGVARSFPFILAVNPNVPAQTFQEYIALAKAKPKGMSYSTYGLGSVPQLSFEVMSAQAGIEMVHAPYRGGAQSYQAAIAGDVDAVAGTSFTELLAAGKLRPLAIGGDKRSPAFPQIPTFKELGYGSEIFGPVFYGIAAPKGTPQSVVDKLAGALNSFSSSPDVADRLQKFATEPATIGSEQLRKMVSVQSAMYAPLIQKLGLASE